VTDLTWFRCARCGRLWRTNDPVRFSGDTIEGYHQDHLALSGVGRCTRSTAADIVELGSDVGAVLEAALAVGGYQAAQKVAVAMLRVQP
jgi:hypothetical protein